MAMISPNPKSSDDDFCKVFFKIIKSAVENNFEDLKSTPLGATLKRYNKVEKWKSIENFEGYDEGVITKSFGTSYTCNLYTCVDMGDAMVRMYEQISFTIDDCLSPAWQIYETPKEGFHKKLSISRRDASEVLNFPNINLEILQFDGKYVLQLRIVK
jgi:hypothetical protein